MSIRCYLMNTGKSCCHYRLEVSGKLIEDGVEM